MDMGATVEQGGVRFRVWAPDARQVDVEYDGHLVPLERNADGTWAARVRDLGAGARYRFRLNGDACYPDPYSRSQPDGPHGPSEVVDPDAFVWHDQDWPGTSMQGQVIYQLHVGTFTAEGTF